MALLEGQDKQARPTPFRMGGQGVLEGSAIPMGVMALMETTRGMVALERRRYMVVVVRRDAPD